MQLGMLESSSLGAAGGITLSWGVRSQPWEAHPCPLSPNATGVEVSVASSCAGIPRHVSPLSPNPQPLENPERVDYSGLRKTPENRASVKGF